MRSASKIWMSPRVEMPSNLCRLLPSVESPTASYVAECYEQAIKENNERKLKLACNLNYAPAQYAMYERTKDVQYLYTSASQMYMPALQELLVIDFPMKSEVESLIAKIKSI